MMGIGKKITSKSMEADSSMESKYEDKVKHPGNNIAEMYSFSETLASTDSLDPQRSDMVYTI
jgi:hypothetical protein